MQAINAIQNSIINANAAINAGLVVDAANGHRLYQASSKRSRGVKPFVMRPRFERTRSVRTFVDFDGSDMSHWCRTASTTEPSVESSSRLASRWNRLDADHPLPGSAWAMLVLSQSLCG